MITMRKIFIKQMKDFLKNAELKAAIAKNDYQSKYGKVMCEID